MATFWCKESCPTDYVCRTHIGHMEAQTIDIKTIRDVSKGNNYNVRTFWLSSAEVLACSVSTARSGLRHSLLVFVLAAGTEAD